MPKSLRELINENNIVFITSIRSSEAASNVIFRLMSIAQENPKKEIQLYISSWGGSFLDMIAIYDTIKAIKNPISGYCIGVAGQYAALLLAACDKGKRFILKHSEISFHEPNGYIGSGDQQTEIVIAAKEAKIERETFEKALAKETGQPLKKIHQDCVKGKELNAEEAVKYGFVDVILE